MRDIRDWLDEYGVSHRDPMNKLIHWICVPLIMISLIGLLWEIPVPETWALRSPFFNWAVCLMSGVLVYDYLLSWRLAIGMTVTAVGMVAIVYGASLWLTPMGWFAAGVFVLAWVGQFIGHRIEGKKPSFLKDIQFLLIGPLWLLAFIYDRVGLPIDRAVSHS